jgi:uncharacterized protein (TIGR02284 family)
MSNCRNEVVQSLTLLARLCRDSATDYRVAAQKASTGTAKRVCAEKAEERVGMLREIEEALLVAGGRPPSQGTAAAAAFRDWFSIKAQLTPDRRVVPLLEECERAEGETKAAIEQLLDGELPATLRDLIQRQYAQVLSTHDQLRALTRRGRLS